MSQSSPCWHALRRTKCSGAGVVLDGLSEPEWRRRLAHYGPIASGEHRQRRSGGSWSPRSGMWWSAAGCRRHSRPADRRRARRRRDRCGAPAQRGDRITTELRAHRAIEALVALEVARARVLRAGLWREVDARDLVPGDVIHLEPARRSRQTRGCWKPRARVVEASLTGEPAPAKKRADLGLARTYRCRPSHDGLQGDDGGGRAGKAAVVATGMATEVGRIGALAGAVEDRTTPLERRLDVLGRRLALLALAVAALVALLGYGRAAPAAELIQTAIALAVAAVPEGLPVVATIAMASAYAAWRAATRW